MKRLFLFGFVGALSGVLAGCPIFDDKGGGRGNDEEECRGTDCTPIPAPGCVSSVDCGVNETCGEDNECHVGDCSIWGCSKGFTCDTTQVDKPATCEPDGSSSSGMGGAGMGGAGMGGAGGVGGAGGAGGVEPAVMYCGNPGDCPLGETCAPDGTCKAGDCSDLGCIFGFFCSPDLTCKPSNPAACGADADCPGVGNGYLCVNGVCTAPADQCSDQTQCQAGHKCADGKCVSVCAADADCPAGYACNQNLSLCINAADPCVITNDCGSKDAVCVDGACVPRSDGASCPAGTVWVENGCVPDQAAEFFCNADGQQDKCSLGSICLHHNCYISCEPPNDNACNNLPSFNVCKTVATSSGSHKVCGSNQNLGSECDPTLGQDCPSGQVCLDGYCK
jgi:hypothetical protein